MTIVLPKDLGNGGVRTKGFVGHPRKPDLIKGNIQGEDLVQYVISRRNNTPRCAAN